MGDSGLEFFFGLGVLLSLWSISLSLHSIKKVLEKISTQNERKP
jgi:hypothetical protein